MLNDRERRIHLLLRDHPYLIDPSLKGQKPEFEAVREDKRIDLLFRVRHRLLIVEVKRTILRPQDIDQLISYCKIVQEEGILANRHYLVGRSPKNKQALESYLGQNKFKIMLRYFVYDIPTDLIWDNLENRYVQSTDEYLSNPRYQGQIKIRI